MEATVPALDPKENSMTELGRSSKSKLQDERVRVGVTITPPNTTLGKGKAHKEASESAHRVISQQRGPLEETATTISQNPGPSVRKQGTQGVQGSSQQVRNLAATTQMPSIETPHKLQPTPDPPQGKNWTTLFIGTKLAAKGLNLNYIAPVVKDGIKLVQLEKVEVDRETGLWKNADNVRRGGLPILRSCL